MAHFFSGLPGVDLSSFIYNLLFPFISLFFGDGFTFANNLVAVIFGYNTNSQKQNKFSLKFPRLKKFSKRVENVDFLFEIYSIVFILRSAENN